MLVRHGQSIWNLENLFTGWIDVDLTPHGCEEARAAARELGAGRLVPDLVFTSVLKRAIRTAMADARGDSTCCGCRSSAAGGSTSGTTAHCRD